MRIFCTDLETRGPLATAQVPLIGGNRLFSIQVPDPQSSEGGSFQILGRASDIRQGDEWLEIDGRISMLEIFYRTNDGSNNFDHELVQFSPSSIPEVDLLTRSITATQ